MRFEVEPRDATRGLPHLARAAHDDLKRQSACRRFRRTLGRFAAFLCFPPSSSGRERAGRRAGRGYIEKVPRAPRQPGRGSRLRGLVARRVCVEAAEELLERALVIIAARRRDRCYHKVAPVREPADAPDAAGGVARAALRLVARGLEGRLSTQASALKRHALNAWWSRVAKRGFVEQRLRTIATRVGAAGRGPPSGRGALTSCNGEAGLPQNHAAHAIKRVLGRWTKRLQAQAFEVLARRAATARFLIRIG